jgi:hypothetical protein
VHYLVNFFQEAVEPLNALEEQVEHYFPSEVVAVDLNVVQVVVEVRHFFQEEQEVDLHFFQEEVDLIVVKVVVEEDY